MTYAELSREFDLLYDNIMSNQAPGLTEYEKSMFLTRAQEAIVIAMYDGTFSTSFEETEQLSAYLNTLVSQVSPSQIDETVPGNTMLPHIVPGSSLFMLPKNLMFITYEGCDIQNSKFTCESDGTKHVSVIPVTQDEFWRTYRNPFKGANSRRVLRLSYTQDVVESSESENAEPRRISELVSLSGSSVSSYIVRYLRKPSPIITDTFTNGLTIDGATEAATSELPEFLHRKLVENAVAMAKAVWK